MFFSPIMVPALFRLIMFSFGIFSPIMVPPLSIFLARIRSSYFAPLPLQLSPERPPGQIWTPASPDCPQGLRFDASRGIIGICARTGGVYVSNNVRKDPNWHGDVDENFCTKNLLTVPVKTSKKLRNQIVGVIQALNKRGGDFTSHDVEMMKVSAAAISRATMWK